MLAIFGGKARRIRNSLKVHQENIHEDTYLGSGTWDDKYGEQVTGKGKGDCFALFQMHSKFISYKFSAL